MSDFIAAATALGWNLGRAWLVPVAIVAGVLVVSGLVLIGVALIVAHFDRGIEAHVTAALAQEAADWGEPSREQVEWEQHIVDAIGLAETPIHDELAAAKLRAELDNDAAVVLWLSGDAS